jgi:sulfide dehydrogenase cytochrome subunit
MADASPAMLANTCAGCHGTDGASAGPSIPTIAGVSADVFTDVMLSYKNGERTSTIMTRLAKGYTDAEIKAMAEFFAQKPFVKAKQEFDATKAASGEKLHKKFCEKCHEEGGSVSDEGGIMAGQWAPYLHHAMEDFLSGGRKMTEKMQKKVEEMRKAHGDGSVGEVIEYYASQQ